MLDGNGLRVLLGLAMVSAACSEDGLEGVPVPPLAVTTPDIVVEPGSHAFDTLRVGDAITASFTVANYGDGALAVDSVKITGAGADAFSIAQNDVSATTLAPNEMSRGLAIAFRPGAAAAFEAAMEVWSNDPDENPVVIPLSGLGNDPAQGPVAVCSVSPASLSPPTETATFSSTGSYDPDGYALIRYTWTLVTRPDGSAVNLPGCANSQSCGPFAPDVAGIYIAQLVVENELGMTASCTTNLEAVPRESLWIEMYWAHSGDDMDLHLLAPGGTLRTATDCYFMNCVGGGPSWGGAGGADDPALDLDDISGTGPENINIASPAAGTYTVVVHDYPLSSYSAANNVTVTVYIDGQPVHTDTRAISGEDTYTNFCTVAWPSGVVTPL